MSITGTGYLGKSTLVGEAQTENLTPSKVLTVTENIDGNFEIEISPLESVLGDGFLKKDPSPDTEQTFIGDLRTRGAFESFSVSGSETRLVSQGIVFIYNGSAFECLIGASGPFSANRVLQIPDLDGVIAVKSQVDLKADKAGGNNFTGDNTFADKVGVGTTNPMAAFVVSYQEAQGIEINPETRVIQSVNRALGVFDIMQLATTSLNIVYPGVDDIATFTIGQSVINGKLTIMPGTAGTDAINLNQLNTANANNVKKTGETSQTIAGDVIVSGTVKAIDGTERTTLYKDGISHSESGSGETNLKFNDSSGSTYTINVPAANGDMALYSDIVTYVGSFQIENTSITGTPTASSLNTAYPSAPVLMRVYCSGGSGYSCTKLTSGWLIVPGVIST